MQQRCTVGKQRSGGVCVTNTPEDIDPNIQRILNISKESTYREVSKFKDIDDITQRMGGINLTASHVNAYEIAVSLFKAPKFDQLLDGFQRRLSQGTVN